MQKYKLLIAYKGTHYSGWQKQKNSSTIQEKIEAALYHIINQNVSVTGAGRTDAGVHARGQVAHITLNKLRYSQKQLQEHLNTILPEDIRILSIKKVPKTFHARFSAKEKIYTYHISLSPEQSPFLREYSLHLPITLEYNKILTALPYFIGKKNFTAFSNKIPQGTIPYKTLYEISFFCSKDNFSLRFRGDGFLYKMIRNITGTLICIGKNKIHPTHIPEIFEKMERKHAGETLPPHGLFFDSVLY